MEQKRVRNRLTQSYSLYGKDNKGKYLRKNGLSLYDLGSVKYPYGEK